MKNTKFNSSCPFCSTDQTMQLNLMLEYGVDFSKRNVVTLCTECGEPVMVAAAKGMRKPTDKEYEEINDDPRTKIAREGFLQLKQNLMPPIEEKWDQFREVFLDQWLRLVKKTQPERQELFIRDLFYTGVGISANLIMDELNRQRQEDIIDLPALLAKLHIIKLEVETYIEQRKKGQIHAATKR